MLTVRRTFVKKYVDPPDPCKSDPNCIGDGKAPLLKNLRTNLIDPDTPKAAYTRKAADGSTWNLAVGLNELLQKPELICLVLG